MKCLNFYAAFFLWLFLAMTANCQGKTILPGACQPEEYLPLLKGQNIGLVVNQTSMVNDTHLVDFLISKKVSVKKILAPEHGFRGEAEAGETVSNAIDAKTGIPIISLYGKNKKPTAENLSGLDWVVFDIQDVGCRFFTYISTLHYVMEACAENKIPLLILDRPNPNGDYVDGPVLKPSMKSFVGMDPIPVVYGCTIGELARMINGEGWLGNKQQCDLKIIPIKNYTHSDRYELPVKPSPNLPNDLSVRLYPSLCLFEATNVSIGRGTTFPFQAIGYPDSTFGKFSFTPVSIPGVSKNPPQENKKCYGIDFRNEKEISRFTLHFFIDFFNRFKNPALFWNSEKWIGQLTGDPNFYNQINNHLTESEIRKSWKTDLEKYQLMRKKYLLYPDFE
ncbi:MAG TPA: DUF1343 domain-containing protein [Prolixibacteraceae bacterium]|nr:DUF1343 domain-containing protein [Prolixibacteraceae bacterium]HPS12652.1 DUF1343 domain-containing protein [Prolixibacteraceae bacterium]